MQNTGDGERPIAFESKKLAGAEVNYPVHELELLAIIHCLKVFRCYLEGQKVLIRTDHKSLEHLKTQKNLSRRLVRWMEYMAQFDVTIEYKKGHLNVVADELSREICELNYTLQEEKEEKILEGIIIYLSKNSVDGVPEEVRNQVLENSGKFTLEGGNLIRKDTGIHYTPLEFRLDLVSKIHKGLGHFGPQATYDLVKTQGWWPSMKQDIQQWVKSCMECQLHTMGKSKNSFLKPLDYNISPFSRWALDFVGPLPTSTDGSRWILTGIEYVTRWPIARALKDATAGEVAKFIYEEIVTKFGCPVEILTDQGANFNAACLKEYMSNMSIKHLRTSGYHPRTNGLNEKLNGILVGIIKKLVGSRPSNWTAFLPQALFACRVKNHTTTGVSPFELCYGVLPRLPGDFGVPMLQQEVDFKKLEEFRKEQVKKLASDRKEAGEKTRKRQEDSKKYYDKTVKSQEWKVGELVLLSNESREKLDAKWEGLWEISEVLEDNRLMKLKKRGEKDKFYGPVSVDRLKKAVVSFGPIDSEGYPLSGGEC